ncbi:MAG: DUF721 domain-containing protein [Ignavibacteria bacterium]|nr:MAG: DUF721 domain-containing protein [Ignavibacteria bacterium]
MRKSATRSISSGISAVLDELSLGRTIKQYEILDAWPRIVGSQIASVSTAERMRDGKLFVHVPQAEWRNELIFLKKDLIEKINTAMHQDIVNDIIFR